MLYKILKVILYPIFKIIYLFKIENKPIKLPEGNLIICANHLSNLDPIIVALVTDRKVNFMAKKELFKFKFFGKILNALGAFPVDRKASDIESIRKAMSILKSNDVLGIFPEGTRIMNDKDIKLSNFNNGIAMIASRSNSDILPIEIKGKYSLFGGIKIIYKEIIRIEDYKNIPNKTEQYDKITEEVFNRIYKS